MNAVTMSTTATHAAPEFERVTAALLLGFVAAVQVSIALAHVLLAAMFLSWIALRIQDWTRPAAPSFFVALLAYGALTLVSAAFSVDPSASLIDSKQLLLLAIVPAVYDIARGSRASTVVNVIISVGAASAVYGIVQYGVLHYDNLGQRPQGTLSHYMTYSGVLMLAICAATARLVFGSRDRTWPALVMPALVVALALTFTRNAWIGACVAIGLLFVLKDFRLTALLPVILAVLFVVAPDGIINRLTSTFNAQDPANQDRFAMVEIGARMVKDHPLTGVGPNMVSRVYDQYRPDYAVNEVNPHLHNVPLQIAAERGLPALAAWAWFVVALVGALFRMFRQSASATVGPPGDPTGRHWLDAPHSRTAPANRRRERMLAAGALASIAAMLAAGLFEYNFGDSEFLMLFLVLITLPFAAARQDDAAAARA
ncbi:MAG: O-antigen ligase family protein [Acidobacteria bacterium]|nr:O-antigen ligase family protein [Acidobacteriota bacterium]